MDRQAHKSLLVTRAAIAALAVLVLAGLLLNAHSALGAKLNSRSLDLGNSEAGQSTTYKLAFGIATAGTLGSIRVQFCSNNPLVGYPCTAPGGFDVSAATLTSQTGETGFSIDSTDTTANVLVLTRTPAADSIQNVSYILSGVTNPSAEGSYYARVETFATADASGADTDYGGLAFDIVKVLQVNAEVPPFIIFCAAVTIPAYSCSGASGQYVNLGQLSSQATGSGQSQLLVATNAGSGYTIYAQGTTLTSGNYTIGALSVPSGPAPGIAQFGINLRSNLDPPIGQNPAGPGLGAPTTDYNQPNKFAFNSDDVIAGYSAPEDYRRYTVSYIADIGKNQTPGVYSSTITYVATGNF